jgi:hypothetical protein
MKGQQSLVVAIALIVAVTTSVQADPNQYHCIVEHSAGLHYDPQSNTWGPKPFGVERKYILRRLTDDDRKGELRSFFLLAPKANWAFFEFGNKLPAAICVEDVEAVLASMFICNAVVSDASFDKDSARFEILHHGSYIDKAFGKRFAEKTPNLTRKGSHRGRQVMFHIPMTFSLKSASAAHFNRPTG